MRAMWPQVDGGASLAKLIRNSTKAKTPVTCVVGKQVRCTALPFTCLWRIQIGGQGWS